MSHNEIKTINTYTSEIFVEAFTLEMLCGGKEYIDTAEVKSRVQNIMQSVGEIGDLTGVNAQHALLLELTGLMDEHPEGWHGDCHCRECLTAE